jgi:Zn finger protein HypA/HybF involved in hydrogenase expression
MTLYQLKCKCCGSNVVLDDADIKCKACLNKEANKMLQKRFGKHANVEKIVKQLNLKGKG